MNDAPIPCTTPGCEAVKFFRGRCNPCQKVWEAANLTPLVGAGSTESWVDESMRKVGAKGTRR